jgi:acyl-coenzyme A thioesterase PaaI-like protein
MCPLDLGVVHSAEQGTPFQVTLGAQVEAIDRSSATFTLDCPKGLRNHLDGPHAAALFGLAEVTAAAIVVTRFEDLIMRGYLPVIKSAEISYLAIAVGRLTAVATFAGDEQAVRTRAATGRTAVFPVDVVVTDAAGTKTTTMRAEMALKKLG